MNDDLIVLLSQQYRSIDVQHRKEHDGWPSPWRVRAHSVGEKGLAHQYVSYGASLRQAIINLNEQIK